MKKRWISYVSSIAASVVLMFAGCSNITDGEISGGEKNSVCLPSDENASKVENTVVAKINGLDSSAMVSQLISRTVLPTPQALDGDGLVYVLSGKSEQNTIAAYKATVADGALTISFPDTSLWEVTLTAYQSSADASDTDNRVQEIAYLDGSETKYAYNPVLTATTAISFENGTPTPVFNMSVKGLETPGTVSVRAPAGFSVGDNAVAVTKYEIALYDIVDGSLVQTAEETPADATTGAVDKNDVSDNKSLFTAKDFTVAPGEYLLGITFYNTYNSADKKVGFWSDYVVVAPGQTTEFDQVVSGINEKPAAPENFMAQLVAGSEDNDSYLVKFTWDDKSTNESNFEIDLYEVADENKAAEFTAADNTLLARLGFKSLYNDEDIETYKVVDFKDGSRWYGAGSLFAGSESATLKLETGKLYEVVLRAALSADDKSDDVARIACTDAKLESGNTAYTADTNHINRVRLSYIAQPYTISTDNGTTKTAEYVAYDIYEGTDIDLLTSAGFKLYNGTAEVPASGFKGWLDAANADNSTDYASKTYITSTTYKNVTVLADVAYDVNASASTYEYAEDVTSSLVTLTPYKAEDGSADTALTIESNATSVNATTYSKLKIEINDSANDYNSYRISIDGVSLTQTASSTLYLSRYASGTHSVVAAGYKIDASGNTTAYSYSFTLTIER